MNKKVIDIIRRSQEKTHVIQPKPFVIPWKILCAFFLLLAGGGGVVGVPLVWGSATLEVHPESKEVSISKVVNAVVNLVTIDQAGLRIPALVLEKQEEGTRLFSSTGKAQKGEYAKGMIKVFNAGSATQTLVASTRFISQDGKLFRSEARITIPAATQGNPGTYDVRVVAVEAGDAYNISQSSFSLPGLAGSAPYTLVYGKSIEPMKGGTTKEIPVVTKEDIETAKNQLFESLQNKAEIFLKTQLQEGYEIPENGFVTETLSASSLVKEGAELAQFSSSAKIKVRGFSFKVADLNILLDAVLSGQVQASEELKQETVQVQYEVGNIDRVAQSMSLDSFIQGKTYAKLDVPTLQGEIAGKSIESAEASLLLVKGMLSQNLSLWPFWMRSVPLKKERIHIDIQY